MRDLRVEQLARLVVAHSCVLAAGERVTIEAVDVPPEIVLFDEKIADPVHLAQATPTASVTTATDPRYTGT